MFELRKSVCVTRNEADFYFPIQVFQLSKHSAEEQQWWRSDLFGLPAAAVYSLGADVLHVKAVDHFGAVFTDARVHHALLTATPVQVLADEEPSDGWEHRHGHSHHQMLWGEEDTKHGLQHETVNIAAHQF